MFDKSSGNEPFSIAMEVINQPITGGHQSCWNNIFHGQGTRVKHREWSSHHRIGNPYSCHYISLLTVMWQSPKMGMFRLLTKAHIIIFLLPALIAKGEAFMFTSWINTQYVYIYIYMGLLKNPLSCHSFSVRSLFMSSCFLFKSGKFSGFPRVYNWNHSTSLLDPYLCPLISC